MKTIATITITCLLSAHAFAQGLRTHTNEDHGFSLSHPSDWTVKQAVTEATVFKAVKKFADGQYLMFTVNAQMLDGGSYSMNDFTIEGITGFARKMYEAGNVNVLDSHRAQVGDLPCVKLLLDISPPIIQARTEYSTYVIKRAFLYTVSVSCNKPLYQQYGGQLKQLRDSFAFTDSPSAVRSGSTPQQSHDVGNDRFVVETSGESPFSALLKSCGGVFLKFLIIAVLFSAGAAVWAKIKTKSKSPGPPNQNEDSDKEYMIEHTCRFCGAALESPERLRGQSETCPKCGQENAVPNEPDDTGSADEDIRIELDDEWQPCPDGEDVPSLPLASPISSEAHFDQLPREGKGERNGRVLFPLGLVCVGVSLHIIAVAVKPLTPEEEIRGLTLGAYAFKAGIPLLFHAGILSVGLLIACMLSIRKWSAIFLVFGCLFVACGAWDTFSAVSARDVGDAVTGYQESRRSPPAPSRGRLQSSEAESIDIAPKRAASVPSPKPKNVRAPEQAPRSTVVPPKRTPPPDRTVPPAAADPPASTTPPTAVVHGTPDSAATLAKSHVENGFRHFGRGDVEKAIKSFRTASQLNPRDHEAHCLLGKCYWDLERYDRAAESFRRAAQLDSSDVATRLFLGLSLSELGNYSGAIAAYETVLKIDSDYASAHLSLGVAYLGLGDPQAAVDCLEKYTLLEPDAPVAYTLLGNAYTKLERHAQAALMHERAKQLREAAASESKSR